MLSLSTNDVGYCKCITLLSIRFSGSEASSAAQPSAGPSVVDMKTLCSSKLTLLFLYFPCVAQRSLQLAAPLVAQDALLGRNTKYRKSHVVP